MKGDFSRNTFDPLKHYSRVLRQQGRVTLDADDNEQTAILLHYLRTLARDLIGPFGAPAEHPGFRLAYAAEDGLTIRPGRYYVDGLLVENDAAVPYVAQPDWPLPDDDPLAKEIDEQTGKVFWVYLDVWERHITLIDDPSIHEVALGAADTCTRARIVWQVKSIVTKSTVADADESAKARVAALDAAITKVKAQLAAETNPALKKRLQAKLDSLQLELDVLKSKTEDVLVDTSCGDMIDGLEPAAPPTMTARVDPGRRHDDPCVMSPTSKYRGAENQLYRVEVHEGGPAASATFKWSRDNGSLASAWLGSDGSGLTAASARGFTAGNWVELSDDRNDLQGKPGTLVKIAKVAGDTLTTDPSTTPPVWSAELEHPVVRRWDQVQNERVKLTAGVVAVKDALSPAWLDLEDGIQVQFSAGDYRTGDYWLIPARVADGDIEWPAVDGKRAPQPPLGIRHHYAPIGFIGWKDKAMKFQSCRCEFQPLSDCLKGLAEPVAKLREPERPRAPKRPRRGGGR